MVACVTLCCDMAGGDWDGGASVRELSFSAAEGPRLESFGADGSGGLVLEKESVIFRGRLLPDCIATQAVSQQVGEGGVGLGRGAG